MDRKELVAAVGEGLSTYGLADRFGQSQTNIRYWLKKHGLKTKHKKYLKCVLCSKRTNGKRKCNSCRTKIRRYRVRMAAVKRLGGKCRRCGWSGPAVGFDFHHRSGKKEFNISHVANKSWTTVKRELDKCELLCAVCHRLEYSSYEDPKLRREIENYQGTLLGD